MDRVEIFEKHEREFMVKRLDDLVAENVRLLAVERSSRRYVECVLDGARRDTAWHDLVEALDIRAELEDA